MEMSTVSKICPPFKTSSSNLCWGDALLDNENKNMRYVHFERDKKRSYQWGGTYSFPTIPPTFFDEEEDDDDEEEDDDEGGADFFGAGIAKSVLGAGAAKPSVAGAGSLGFCSVVADGAGCSISSQKSRPRTFLNSKFKCSKVIFSVLWSVSQSYQVFQFIPLSLKHKLMQL